MDEAGDLYGSRLRRRVQRRTVFKLTPSGGSWTYTVLHDFTGGSDGASPGGLIIHENGNLYGATDSGGAYGGCGVSVLWNVS